MPAAERIYVKWKTPAEELISVSKLAFALVDRSVTAARQVCVAVPSYTWALQMKKAFDGIHVPVDMRIPNVPLSPKAKSGLATLRLIAHPEDPALLAAWQAAGRTDAELDKLVSEYSSAGSAALLRVTGLQDCPELESARRHPTGEENAQQLYDLLIEQHKNPTVPEAYQLITLMPYQLVGSHGETYEQIFFAGCIDGLIPGPAAYENDTPEKRQAALDAARAAFQRTLNAGTKRIFVSGFAKMQVEAAQNAHVRYGRTKMENGTKLAMTQPSPFLSELESGRPSSLGGQALLRMYHLN